ncbi:MAG: LysR family transcriptional regulator [Chlorobiaceae bacterium]|nr:LysR family transcriptional regulator [Chlorobiaceae bacterium]
MIDFRLKVFDTVARRLSFTKAAEELCITQPAVTRHIRELERQMNLRLFERQGNRVALSEGGRIVLKHTEAIHAISRQLEDELNMLSEVHRGSLSIGASTTIAQYVLPPLLAMFHRLHGEVRLSMLNANTEQIEEALLQGKITLGLIEGESKRRDINYTPFARDEIILICNPAHPLARKEEIRLDDLAATPLLLREPGSGTLEVIASGLKLAGLRLSDMKVEMHLGSSESIKSYLMNSQECMAFISRDAVKREIEEGRLKTLRVRKLSMHRQFYFITLHGQSGGLGDLFMRFSVQQRAGR